jgi:hypothetical protein
MLHTTGILMGLMFRNVVEQRQILRPKPVATLAVLSGIDTPSSAFCILTFINTDSSHGKVGISDFAAACGEIPTK